MEEKSKNLTNITASFINSVANVPDAIATSFMVGVSPIHGMYSNIFGPTISSLISNSELMITSGTVAAAVAAGAAIAGIPEEQKLPSLFLLTVLVGAFLLVFGLLKAGRLMKYVSYSVMRGFLYGVGILLILNSIPDLVGYEATGPNAFVTLWDTFSHIGQWEMSALLVSVITFIVIQIIGRTKLSSFSSVLALIVASLVVMVLSLADVTLVQDISSIPRGLPSLTLPSLSMLTPSLIFSAFSLAIIVAVQGVGVSQMAENPDGSVDTSRDMLAQGASNVVSGFFGGIPVGASVGQTAMNISNGATSRISGILTGVWMLLIVLFLAPLIEQIPIPAITVLIVISGFSSVNVNDIKAIFQNDFISKISFSVTLLGVILLDIPTAILIGLITSIVLTFIDTSNDIEVTRVSITDTGHLKREEMVDVIPQGEPIIIQLIGDLYFSGANTLQNELPKVGDTKNPVVILDFHGSTQMGSTLINVIDGYAEDLYENGGKLYLTGLDTDQIQLLESTNKVERGKDVEIYTGTSVFGETAAQAYEEAKNWLTSQSTGQAN